jgi:hypothetical protein
VGAVIIIIIKSSSDRDNNYCHYVIQRIAGFAITLKYHHHVFTACLTPVRVLSKVFSKLI